MSLPSCIRAAATAISGYALLAVPALAPATDAAVSPPANCTGPASSTWLNVSIDGVHSGEGLMAVTLYADNPRKFLVKRGSLYVGRTEANHGTTHTCIFVPGPGVYALAVYHDENANQKFDRTGIGFPNEGFGFSNNPATLAGLPSFRSVRLAVPRSGLNTRIQMKYP
jgi:uncharacterized protein (DUF2141 family)